MVKEIEVYEKEAHEVELFRRIPEVDGRVTPIVEISVKLYFIGDNKTPEQIGKRMNDIAVQALKHRPEVGQTQGPDGELIQLPGHGEGGEDGRRNRRTMKRSDRDQMGSPYPPDDK